MIELTTLKGDTFYLNISLIYRLDRIPDTVITLTDGKKLWVRETPEEVVERVRAYQKSVYSTIRIAEAEVPE